MKGTIIKGIGGFYYVKLDNGDVIETRARGIFRKENIKPMIGDVVECENGSVEKIYDRKNSLVRPSVSNIDNLVIVAAVASPSPDFLLIDKMAVNAEIAGIKPIICINKTDLESDEAVRNAYKFSGYPVISISATEEKGIDELLPYLKNKTTAFAGLSGVGKSSILGLLTENEIETGKVSDKIQRGKHTTRHIELFPLKEGGFCLDTPGFSTLEVVGIKADELSTYFPEMRDNNCYYKTCSHIKEPDCDIKRRLEEGLIPQSRMDSYIEIYDALKKIKDWEK